jgi:hypothetical protein
VQDYRIDLLRGVMARDGRRLAEAAALLAAAHALAPREPAPALELAVTDEWRGQAAAARRLYQSVLAGDAASRGALLGLARVDRSQYRFAEARRIYRRLMDTDPSDIDARNGLAWIDLAQKRVEEARGEFKAVMAASPENEEAKAGLLGSRSAWRYQLDLAAGFTSGASGAAPGGGAELLTYLNATSQVDIGYTHNGSQLRTSELAVTTLLPLNDYHVGVNHSIPLSYHWSVSYDFRDHGALPAEHWLAANAGSYLAGGLQWFAGVRESFGAPQWDNQLVEAGLTAGLGHHWEVVGTGYYGAYTAVGLDGARLGRGHDFAFSGDLNRQGPGNFFLNVGAGYSPDTKAVDVHGRVALPLGARNVIVFSLDRISAGEEYQGLTTFRHYF